MRHLVAYALLSKIIPFRVPEGVQGVKDICVL